MFFWFHNAHSKKYLLCFLGVPSRFNFALILPSLQSQSSFHTSKCSYLQSIYICCLTLFTDESKAHISPSSSKTDLTFCKSVNLLLYINSFNLLIFYILSSLLYSSLLYSVSSHVCYSYVTVTLH